MAKARREKPFPTSSLFGMHGKAKTSVWHHFNVGTINCIGDAIYFIGVVIYSIDAEKMRNRQFRSDKTSNLVSNGLLFLLLELSVVRVV